MLKRFIADRDSVITNAYKIDLIHRGTDANMGAADSLEVFSIYAQASSSSFELARTLVHFPVNQIVDARSNSQIPQSGSVDFYLRLFNVKHTETLPKQFTLSIMPISQSWDEGDGIDMESYKDETAVNWISASVGVPWTTPGGSYITSSTYNSFFDLGTEDLELNITSLVENWMSNTIPNNGVGIMLSASLESDTRSWYTKKFSARSSEYFFKRPIIEARWNSSFKDYRGNFYASSSLLAEDNLYTIYLYNFVRGQYKDIPGIGTGSIYVRLYNSASNGDEITTSAITGSWYSTGIYSANFALDTTASKAYDRWFNGSNVYHTGTIKIHKFDSYNMDVTPKYVTTITNLKPIYSNEETARFRLFVREKDWKPTIYTVSNAKIQNQIIDNAYYRVYRVMDDMPIINYGTGSNEYTKMSFDVSGNYFDLDMSILQKDYMYGMKFVYKINSNYIEQPYIFKFRVE